MHTAMSTALAAQNSQRHPYNKQQSFSLSHNSQNIPAILRLNLGSTMVKTPMQTPEQSANSLCRQLNMHYFSLVNLSLFWNHGNP